MLSPTTASIPGDGGGPASSSPPASPNSSASISTSSASPMASATASVPIQSLVDYEEDGAGSSGSSSSSPAPPSTAPTASPPSATQALKKGGYTILVPASVRIPGGRAMQVELQIDQPTLAAVSSIQKVVHEKLSDMSSGKVVRVPSGNEHPSFSITDSSSTTSFVRKSSATVATATDPSTNTDTVTPSLVAPSTSSTEKTFMETNGIGVSDSSKGSSSTPETPPTAVNGQRSSQGEDGPPVEERMDIEDSLPPELPQEANQMVESQNGTQDFIQFGVDSTEASLEDEPSTSAEVAVPKEPPTVNGHPETSGEEHDAMDAQETARVEAPTPVVKETMSALREILRKPSKEADESKKRHLPGSSEHKNGNNLSSGSDSPVVPIPPLISQPLLPRLLMPSPPPPEEKKLEEPTPEDDLDQPSPEFELGTPVIMRKEEATEEKASGVSSPSTELSKKGEEAEEDGEVGDDETVKDEGEGLPGPETTKRRRRKGVDSSIVCTFSDPSKGQCKQRAILGFTYCIRHILLDPSAPYKQCQHRRKPKSKKERETLCTNAVRKDKNTDYCSTHLIMHGMKEPKKKKVETTNSSSATSTAPPSASDPNRERKPSVDEQQSPYVMLNNNRVQVVVNPSTSQGPAPPQPVTLMPAPRPPGAPPLHQGHPPLLPPQPSAPHFAPLSQLMQHLTKLGVSHPSHRVVVQYAALPGQLVRHQEMSVEEMWKNHRQVVEGGQRFFIDAQGYRLSWMPVRKPQGPPPVTPNVANGITAPPPSHQAPPGSLTRQHPQLAAKLLGAPAPPLVTSQPQPPTTPAAQLPPTVLQQRADFLPYPAPPIKERSQSPMEEPMEGDEMNEKPRKGQKVIRLHQKRQKRRMAGAYRSIPLVEHMCRTLEDSDFDHTDLFPLGLEPSDDEDNGDGGIADVAAWLGACDWKMDGFLEDSPAFQGLPIKHTTPSRDATQLYLIKKRLRLERHRLLRQASDYAPVMHAAKRFPRSTASALRERAEPQLAAKRALSQRVPRRCCHLVDGSRCTRMCLPLTNYCDRHVLYSVNQKAFSYCTQSCCGRPVLVPDAQLWDGRCRLHRTKEQPIASSLRSQSRKQTTTEVAAPAPPPEPEPSNHVELWEDIDEFLRSEGYTVSSETTSRVPSPPPSSLSLSFPSFSPPRNRALSAASAIGRPSSIQQQPQLQFPSMPLQYPQQQPAMLSPSPPQMFLPQNAPSAPQNLGSANFSLL